MAKGRKTQNAKPARGTLWITLAIGAVVIAGVEYYFTTRSSGGVGTYTPVTEWNDVHGLAINPENPREVYVATHRGLIRGVDDKDWSRVGDSRDDLMGFSMHPKNGSIFWSSGHPTLGGNLGVRISNDGGFTWNKIALDGVDFHAMAVSPADPNAMWGYWRGALYHSTDGGHDWSTIGTNTPQVRALTADPKNATTAYATTGAGPVVSRDSGATWTPLAGIPALGLAVDPTKPRIMYAGLDGGISKSTDAGASWTRTSFDKGGSIAYLAVNPNDGNVVYAASYQTGLYKTTDAGATWTTVRAPP